MYFASKVFISAMTALRLRLVLLLVCVSDQPLAGLARDADLQIEIADVHADLLRG